MSEVPSDFGERMLTDRKNQKLSRNKYAEKYGLTPTKIANLERGRKPRPEELALFTHLLGDPVVAFEDPPTDRAEDSLRVVARRYAEVHQRLAGRAAPFPWTAEWGTPGEHDPQWSAAITDWCAKVDRHLDALEGTSHGFAGTPDDKYRCECGTSLRTFALLADHLGVAGNPEASGELAQRVTDLEPKPEPEPEPEAVEYADVVAAEGDELADVTEVSVSFPDDGLRRYSNSELKTFKRCRRKWWFSYYRRLGLADPSKTGAAPLGTRIHRCLSVYYVPEGQPRGNPLEELERTALEDLALVGGDTEQVAAIRKDIDLAHAMLEGYMEWLAETGADEGLTVIASEARVEVDPKFPTAPDARLIAKMDVRATRTMGRDVSQLFIDHKTVGDLTSPTKMLNFDEQMLHYHLCEYLDLIAAGADGEADRTDGALYNMLRKVKRTARSTPPFYARVEVRHNLDTLRSYWLRVKGEVEAIMELTAKLDAGVDPREVAFPMPTRDCSWDCDFYHVCTMADDGSRLEDALSSMFISTDPLARYASEEPKP